MSNILSLATINVAYLLRSRALLIGLSWPAQIDSIGYQTRDKRMIPPYQLRVKRITGRQYCVKSRIPVHWHSHLVDNNNNVAINSQFSITSSRASCCYSSRTVNYCPRSWHRIPKTVVQCSTHCVDRVLGLDCGTAHSDTHPTYRVHHHDHSPQLYQWLTDYCCVGSWLIEGSQWPGRYRLQAADCWRT